MLKTLELEDGDLRVLTEILRHVSGDPRHSCRRSVVNILQKIQRLFGADHICVLRGVTGITGTLNCADFPNEEASILLTRGEADIARTAVLDTLSLELDA